MTLFIYHIQELQLSICLAFNSCSVFECYIYTILLHEPPWRGLSFRSRFHLIVYCLPAGLVPHSIWLGELQIKFEEKMWYELEKHKPTARGYLG